ncbi:MAG TPA: hypothetical protein VFT32_09260, partial [Candidatus Eisenbacteria bacterium]|nr:hypothetical protein [Candidatus Eisenbacteria bacterium]
PADGVVRIPLTVTPPVGALGLGSVTVTVSYANGGGRAAAAGAAIIAATDGRPEIWPAAPTWSAGAGSSGSVAYQIRSQIGTPETVVLTAGRSNPDPNNAGAEFQAGPAPTSVLLPAGGTVPVSIPVTLAGNAWAGSLNQFQMTVTSNEGISTATAFALVESEDSGSLPLGLRPAGLVPLVAPPTGRDGPAALPARGAWLLPAGAEGIRVWRASSTDSIGLTDANADGGDDRLIGTIRIPGYAAALAAVPGFVAASGETLDLGLLAAGPSGLMLLDLRAIEDPAFGAWEDFFDTDGNGVDDRILRTIPMAGFATDVAWTRSASGRLVAFVAAADAGSDPVSPAFDPALTAPGSGAGIVAVDVTTAVDSLSGLPVVAGTWATPGNALDVEVRGTGSAATIAVADGASGLAVADVAIGGGAPATVAFTPRAATPLSAAWGVPYARDAAWVSNTGASTYLAIASGAGGLQIARVPASGPPVVVVAQQMAGAPCGATSTFSGLIGVAQNGSGVALLQAPGAAALDQVAPGAPPPYTAPVVLARGASWPGGGEPLERASFASPAGGATSLAFEPTAGAIPGLFVSDRTRVLVLRPGALTITAVELEPSRTPPMTGRVRLDVFPNPSRGACVVRARGVAVSGGGDGLAGAPAPDLGAETRIEIVDVGGRVVRVFSALPGGRSPELRHAWDGRDDRGLRVPSGRYWARVQTRHPYIGAVVPLVIVR